MLFPSGPPTSLERCAAVGGRPPFLTRRTSPQDLLSVPTQWQGWFSQSKAPRESKEEATDPCMTQVWESQCILPPHPPGDTSFLYPTWEREWGPRR